MTEFDGRGLLVKPPDGGWWWGLELTGYGRGPQRQLVDRATVDTGVQLGRRLSYERDHLIEEWYVNSEVGVEHGFTLRERPAPGNADERLTLDLEVRSNLDAIVGIGTLTGLLFDDTETSQSFTLSGGVCQLRGIPGNNFPRQQAVRWFQPGSQPPRPDHDQYGDPDDPGLSGALRMGDKGEG